MPKRQICVFPGLSPGILFIFRRKPKELPMRKHVKSIVLYALLVIGAVWYPAGVYVDESWYNRDRAIYETQKLAHDSILEARISFLRDSLYDAWVASNDTALRTIQEVHKTPTYAERGYNRKTGRWVCKSRLETKDAICEPETEFVVTGHDIAGYTMDTLWTPGYENRTDWMRKAWEFSRHEAERYRVELPYTGHGCSFETTFMGAGLLCMIVFGMSTIVCIYLGIERASDRRSYRKLTERNKKDE